MVRNSKTLVPIVAGALLFLGVVLPAIYTPVDKVGKAAQTMEVLRAFWMIGNSEENGAQSEYRIIQEELLSGIRAASSSCDMMRVLTSAAAKMDKLFSEVPNSMPIYFTILDGAVCDAWNRPLNVVRVDTVKDRAGLTRAAIGCIVIWSSGKNGVNEYGEGDDVVFPPRRRIRNPQEEAPAR